MNIDQTIEQNIENSVFETKVISCIECGNHFSFSAGEQKYFLEQGFTNQPKRCGNCRVVRRMIRNGEETSKLSRVNCAECNNETTLPFSPIQGKPVYCTGCFIKHGGAKKRNAKVS